MVLLCARDLCAAESAGRHDLDALETRLHGAADRLLHSAAEGNTSFQLSRYILSDELCISIGTANFHDVYYYILARELEQISLQLVDACAALADYDTRLSCINADRNLVSCALNLNLGDACCVQFLFYKLSDLIVFYKIIRKLIAFRHPTRVPIFDYANSESVGIYFLTHYAPPYSSSPKIIVMWLVLLRMRVALPCALGRYLL